MKNKKISDKCSRGYEIVVDYGKPYSECAKDKRVLKNKMRKLEKFYHKSIESGEDFDFFDVKVYKVKNIKKK